MADVDTPQELDLELVRRVQHGESAAFDVLVRKYQHRVVALVGRYIADWSECQDVAQDTFIRAYRAIGSFRGDAQFSTWLHRIAVVGADVHPSIDREGVGRHDLSRDRLRHLERQPTLP